MHLVSEQLNERCQSLQVISALQLSSRYKKSLLNFIVFFFFSMFWVFIVTSENKLQNVHLLNILQNFDFLWEKLVNCGTFSLASDRLWNTVCTAQISIVIQLQEFLTLPFYSRGYQENEESTEFLQINVKLFLIFNFYFFLYFPLGTEAGM